MLRVAVDAVTPGAILARTLYAPTGQPVLRAGHPLHDSILQRLVSFGIRFVWLDEPALAGPDLCEPLASATALRVAGTLTRLAEAAHGGAPRIPPGLRGDLLDIAEQVTEELEALAGGARERGTCTPLLYPVTDDGVDGWIAGVLNRTVLAGLLALAGPYRVQARDFVLAALLQDVGLWRLPGAPHRCHPVNALDGTWEARGGPRDPGGGIAGAGSGVGGTGAGAAGPVGKASGPRVQVPGSAGHGKAAAHVALTLQWLSGVELGGLVRALIAQHHEQLDGGGYPEGLRDDAFHPAARRMAALTAYTVAVEGCAHRPGWLPHEAYEWLLAEGTRLWGADVVEEMAAVLFPYPPGTLVQLDGGPWAMVTDCAGARRLRPRVRLLPSRWQRCPAVPETMAGGGDIDLLDDRTRQITAWAVAWPATAAGAPAPAGGGR